MKSRQNNNLIYQIKNIEKENWYKLVVKILVWKDAKAGNEYIHNQDKITIKEWASYCDRIIETNVVKGKEKTVERLRQIEKIIKRNGGFKNSG